MAYGFAWKATENGPLLMFGKGVRAAKRQNDNAEEVTNGGETVTNGAVAVTHTS